MSKPLVSPVTALQGQFKSPPEGDSQQKETVLIRRHGLTINNIGLLLPEDIMSEVSDEIELCRLPNSPSWLCGMTNLRGNIVPVFDLGRLLDMDILPQAKRKQLYVRVDNEWIGIYCDGLPRRINLDVSNKLDILPPLPVSLQAFILAGYQQEELWFDWDIKAFFAWVSQKT